MGSVGGALGDLAIGQAVRAAPEPRPLPQWTSNASFPRSTKIELELNLNSEDIGRLGLPKEGFLSVDDLGSMLRSALVECAAAVTKSEAGKLHLSFGSGCKTSIGWIRGSLSVTEEEEEELVVLTPGLRLGDTRVRGELRLRRQGTRFFLRSSDFRILIGSKQRFASRKSPPRRRVLAQSVMEPVVVFFFGVIDAAIGAVRAVAGR